MTKKLNFPFSGRLYLQTLKRLKIVGSVSALIMAAANLLIGSRAYEINVDPTVYRDIFNIEPGVEVMSVMYIADMPFMPIILLICAVLAFYAFSFLFDRAKSDFYHSLPQPKASVYLSTFAAVLTWVWGIIIALTAVNAVWHGLISPPDYAAAQAAREPVGFSVPDTLLYALRYLLATLILTGFVSLASSLTGAAIPAVVAFLVLAFAPRVMITLSYSLFWELAPILPQSFSGYLYDYSYDYGFVSIGDFFSLGAYLPVSCLQSSLTPSPQAWVFIYNAALGVIVTALGLLAFCRRKSDLAEKPASNAKLQTVYRVLAALPAGLLCVYFIIRDCIIAKAAGGRTDISNAVIFGVIALLIYFLYELITTKSLKKTLRAALTLPILIGLCALYAAAAFTARAAVYSHVPTADDIESADLGLNTYSSVEDNLYYSVFVNVSVKGDEAKKLVADLYKETVDRDLGSKPGNYRRTVTIKEKSGRTYTRRIGISDDDMQKLTMLAYNEDHILPIHTGYSLGVGAPRALEKVEGYRIVERYVYRVQPMQGDVIYLTEPDLSGELENLLKSMSEEELSAFLENNAAEFKTGEFCIRLSGCPEGTPAAMTCFSVPCDFYELRQKMINRQNRAEPYSAYEPSSYGRLTDSDQTAPSEFILQLTQTMKCAKQAEDTEDGVLYSRGAIVCPRLYMLIVNGATGEERRIFYNSGTELIKARMTDQLVCDNGDINAVLKIIDESENKQIYPDSHGCYAYIDATFTQVSRETKEIRAVLSITESDFEALSTYAQ